MDIHAFGSILQIEDGTKRSLDTPPPAVHKFTRSVESPPTPLELDSLEWGSRMNGPEQSSSGHQTPVTPYELGTGAPSTPRDREITTILQRWNQPAINKWRMATACVFQLGNGFNDGAQGALIPYIEKHYRIGYAVVSLIFVAQAVGFLIAAPVTHFIEARLGRTRGYMVAATAMILAYVTVICQPPFGLVVAAYPLNGFGIALNLALSQVWCANLVNGTTLLGVLHASYGIGATVAPLVATALVSRDVRWSYYYSIPLALQLVGITLAYWAFRDFEKEGPAQLLSALERTASRNATAEHQTTKSQNLKQAFSDKTTWLGSLFIFAYQGAEVSISGWVITFLIKYRHGDPTSVGYVTAGFWAGITIGRLTLSHLAHKIGEKISVVGLTIGSIVLQLLVWLLPNVIGEAVAVAILGLLLGPIYPCSVVVFARLLSPESQMSGLSIISAMGSSGGAVAPFVTGLLSQRLGTVVLHPICLVLFVAMELTWLSLPKIHRRIE